MKIIATRQIRCPCERVRAIAEIDCVRDKLKRAKDFEVLGAVGRHRAHVQPEFVAAEPAWVAEAVA